MTNIRLSLPSVIAIVLIVAAAAFAAGKSVSGPAVSSVAMPEKEAPPSRVAPPGELPPGELPPGHPPTGGTAVMPPGHPAIDDTAGMSTGSAGPSAAGSPLKWKAPPRWKEAPNTSSMRLATYKIPGPDGEAELSVTQAGGSVEANATRWIGQFDSTSQRTAKQSTKKIAGFDVTFVEVQGTYTGGMSGDGGGANMALLGAIVATPGTPHFFKITGPAKTVTSARAELDQLLASLAQSP